VYLIQILLPLQNESGEEFSRRLYNDLARDLTTRFGGLTAYTQSPADGYWEEGPGRAVREPVIIYEVMTDELERPWWGALRERLEIQFSQAELVVRAQEVQRL
jgi:hypothetical protein